MKKPAKGNDFIDFLFTFAVSKLNNKEKNEKTFNNADTHAAHTGLCTVASGCQRWC